MQKIFLKKSLHADNTSLCADTCFWSLLTNVTSNNPDSCLSCENVLDTFCWKSFHFNWNSDVAVAIVKSEVS